MTDRRRLRSANVNQALRYQLIASREGGRLEAMLVADPSGLCVAGAGSNETCEEVAAHVPLFGPKVQDGVFLGALPGRAVIVKKFVIGDSELYACAVGGETSNFNVEIERSIAGAKRILAA